MGYTEYTYNDTAAVKQHSIHISLLLYTAVYIMFRSNNVNGKPFPAS